MVGCSPLEISTMDEFSLCFIRNFEKHLERLELFPQRNFCYYTNNIIWPYFYSIFSSSQFFIGNADSNTIKRNELPIPVLASTVYIKPITKHKNVGLRLELYGCKGGIILRTISLIQLKFVNQRNCTKHQTLDFTYPTIINTTIYNMTPGLHV